jgi:lysozyme
MDAQKIKTLLIRHEGLKFFPYKCSQGKLTIGIGRNIEDKGITKEEALFMLDTDIEQCEHDLAMLIFPEQFYLFPQNIQLVLVNMRFQLGHKGFKSFKKMIYAFQTADYQEAVVQMKDSKWAGQVPTRAKELILMVEKEIHEKTTLR